MAYRNFFDSLDDVKIEVEEGDAGSRAYAPGFSAAVARLAAELAGQLSALEGAAPQEVEVACALQALPSGGFAICRGGAKANFTVRIKWSPTGFEQPGVDPAL